MATLDEYLALGDNTNRVNKSQVDWAFKNKYGMNAPGNIEMEILRSGVNPQETYNRVLRGDYTPEFKEKYPDYMQQSSIAQLAQQQLSQRQEANKPIVSAMQGQKASLGDRYKAILDELKFSENKETDAVTRATSSEYAKRGIPLSSGVYDQALNMSTQPISQNYAVQRALALVQKQQEEDKLAESIATLQAGNPAETLAMGNSLYNTYQSNTNAMPSQEIARREGYLPGISQDAAKTQQATMNEYKSLADLIKQFRA